MYNEWYGCQILVDSRCAHTVRVCADAKARVSACPNRSAEKMERYGREASTLFLWNRPPGLPVM